MSKPQMTVTIPSGYMPLPMVLNELGKGAKTVERLVKGGELRSKWVPRPGMKPERVYSAEDLMKLKEAHAKRRERTALAIPIRPPQQTDRLALVMKEFMERINMRVDRLQLQATEAAVAAAEPAPVRITEKLWLSLKEAIAYSGLAGADLIQQAKDGKITSRKSAGWRFLRRSLEAFEG